MQQNPQDVNLENKRASQEGRKSLVDLSLVEDKALRIEAMDMFSIHKDLWSEHLGIIMATHRTAFLRAGTRPILRQPFRAGQSL